ncbi:MAG: YeeE/YedE family protein [Proteobacteria bacterium]|nr:YeeE/YedE family protein [Pseudomonadota bacterium]
MSIENLTYPLIGGILIGFSASMLLLLKGRIFGVSGLVGGVLSPKTGDTAWRVAALAGLVFAGAILSIVNPDALPSDSSSSPFRYVIAGLLVGFGTQLGSGCTSGHGICGMSRMSPRSIVATLTFIGAGMLIVAIIRSVGGSL